jgi:hypothetical protein
MESARACSEGNGGQAMLMMCERMTSATAFTLTVANAVDGNTPPLISALASEAIAAGTIFGPATIIVKDTEQAETSLVVTSASSNTTLVPAVPRASAIRTRRR